MPRPSGSRNRDYETSRHALAQALAGHLLDDSGEPNTLKGLAAAAGVSVPTLRHYFGDREGVFAAVMQAIRLDSARRLDEMAEPGDGAPDELLTDLLVALGVVWRRYRLGRLVASGLSLGLEHPTRGPAFLDDMLEPLLQAIERLIERLVELGRLPDVEARATALSLFGPVLVALLHQDNLGGDRCRPLDVAAFTRLHVRTVLYGLPGRPSADG